MINFSEFVFKNRRYLSAATLIIPLTLKFFLHGTTSLQLFIIGLILVLAGVSIRIYSASYLLGKHITTIIDADFLCTQGPFSYFRNPLYLGNFIIGIGLCITVNEWYGYTMFFLQFLGMYSIIIPLEEKYLEEKFGKIYLKYKTHTGRFIPKLKGYKDTKSVTPNYKYAVLGEKYHIFILLITYIIIYLLFMR